VSCWRKNVRVASDWQKKNRPRVEPPVVLRSFRIRITPTSTTLRWSRWRCIRRGDSAAPAVKRGVDWLLRCKNDAPRLAASTARKIGRFSEKISLRRSQRHAGSELSGYRRAELLECLGHIVSLTAPSRAGGASAPASDLHPRFSTATPAVGLVAASLGAFNFVYRPRRAVLHAPCRRRLR